MTASLQMMIDAYEAAYQKDHALWGIPCAIEDLLAMKEKPRRRVQIASRRSGSDDAGNQLHEPIYAYGADEIRKQAVQNFEAGIGIFVSRSDEKRMADRRAKWDGWAEVKIAELNAIEAACRKIEDECGYTKAVDDARASSDAVRKIEDAILEYVPETLAEAALKCRWIVQGMESERGYFNDREDFAQVAFASIGRASA